MIFFGIVFLLFLFVIYVRIRVFFDKIKDKDNINKELKKELKKSISEKETISKEFKTLLYKKEKELKFQKEVFAKLSERNEELEFAINEKDVFFASLKDKTNEKISKITSLYSDHLLVQYDISAKYLENKKHPALVEAVRITELKKQTKIYVKQLRELEYKYEVLLQLFPELNRYVDDFETIQLLENADNIEELKAELNEEYFDRTTVIDKNTCPNLEIEKNQKALDRYISSSKTKWQIGRDYELYCGYYYKRKGWDVTYFGIEKKLNDLGRDVIAQKNNERHIIQCKYWSKHKLIHEKHVLQTYGTTIVEEFENSDLFSKITPVLMTNTNLSETATKFAKILGVKVIKEDMGEFPRIKCNINVDSNGVKTKIYHLPFDQQYDKTQIKYEDEFYAYTVKEAVEKGFRRAFRYSGYKTS